MCVTSRRPGIQHAVNTDDVCAERQDLDKQHQAANITKDRMPSHPSHDKVFENKLNHSSSNSSDVHFCDKESTTTVEYENFSYMTTDQTEVPQHYENSQTIHDMYNP